MTDRPCSAAQPFRLHADIFFIILLKEAVNRKLQRVLSKLTKNLIGIRQGTAEAAALTNTFARFEIGHTQQKFPASKSGHLLRHRISAFWQVGIIRLLPSMLKYNITNDISMSIPFFKFFHSFFGSEIKQYQAVQLFIVLKQYFLKMHIYKRYI
ncbi:MAG: hypothetical protein MJ173_03115 [Clostridia bacterium]|nr:hypothetical protein [Clostridia bacterium]